MSAPQRMAVKLPLCTTIRQFLGSILPKRPSSLDMPNRHESDAEDCDLMVDCPRTIALRISIGPSDRPNMIRTAVFEFVYGST